MDCTVRIIKGEIHTRDIKLRAASPEEAVARVRRDLKRHKGGRWELQNVQFRLECAEEAASPGVVSVQAVRQRNKGRAQL